MDPKDELIIGLLIYIAGQLTLANAEMMIKLNSETEIVAQFEQLKSKFRDLKAR